MPDGKPNGRRMLFTVLGSVAATLVISIVFGIGALFMQSRITASNRFTSTDGLEMEIAHAERIHRLEQRIVALEARECPLKP